MIMITGCSLLLALIDPVTSDLSIVKINKNNIHLFSSHCNEFKNVFLNIFQSDSIAA